MNTRKTILDYFLIVILLLLSLTTVYPVLNILVLSFNEPQDAIRGGLYLWPRVPTFDNYLVFFHNADFLNAFLISVLRTVLGGLAGTLFTACFAYAMSKTHLVGRKIWLALMIIPMYISGGLIPYFLMIKDIGLYQNFLVYIIPALFSSYNAIIFITFFKGLPAELEESAKIDGANDMTVFFKIIIPISMPVLATILLFNAVGQWNAWFDSMLYGGKRLITLQAKLVEIMRDAEVTKRFENATGASGNIAAMFSKQTVESTKATAMALTVIPIIMVYPFLQKYFVKGVMIGSVKG